jgi:hypothetical protein
MKLRTTTGRQHLDIEPNPQYGVSNGKQTDFVGTYRGTDPFEAPDAPKRNWKPLYSGCLLVALIGLGVVVGLYHQSIGRGFYSLGAVVKAWF